MKCHEVLEKLTAYADGDLNAEEYASITSHLAACKSCQNAFKEMMALLKAMPFLEEVEPPVSFRVEIMDKVRAEASSQKRTVWQRFSANWYPARVAAAVLIMCLTLTYNIYPLVTAQEKCQEDSIRFAALEPNEAVDGTPRNITKETPENGFSESEDGEPQAIITMDGAEEKVRAGGSDTTMESDTGLTVGGTTEAQQMTFTVALPVEDEQQENFPKRIFITVLGGLLSIMFAITGRRKVQTSQK